jgi:hypothetical protein
MQFFILPSENQTGKRYGSEENCLKRVNSKYGQSNYQLGLVLFVFFYSAAIITAKA